MVSNSDFDDDNILQNDDFHQSFKIINIYSANNKRALY